MRMGCQKFQRPYLCHPLRLGRPRSEKYQGITEKFFLKSSAYFA
jgi:hypothetical protein